MYGSLLATFLPLIVLGSAGAESLDDGGAAFVRSFDEPRSLAGASVPRIGVRVEPGAGRSGSTGLRVERPASGGAGSTTVAWTLPVEKLRGVRVRVEAFVRAEGVARPPKSWNGIKVMLHLAGGAEEWPQAPVDSGSFEWARVGFVRAIPDDVKTADLVLGLEETTGVVVFDDVRVTVEPARPARVAAVGRPDPRHGPGRLRGVMIGTSVDADDLRTLARDWGANHVRWQLLWGGFPNGPADDATAEEYDRWLDGELDWLARLLPVCRQEGITVLIDLHTPPGGRDSASVHAMFRKAEHQTHFLKVWERIVRRFRDDPAVWGYDLLNEPVLGMLPEGVRTWPEMALEAAKRIRAIDAGKAIVVEPAPWGGPEAIDDFEPLPGIEGVVYSVHMYLPHQFTHQGVQGNPKGLTYPGVIAGRKWDKDAVRLALEPARRFERTFNVPIYIGEFSAIRWAPGTSARDYLRDVIDVMEEYGWDWAYHAYREWNSWSFEHGSDPDDAKPSPSPTDRCLLLKSYFARNRVAATP
ncbi:glycoside hydrolase family 5 protein [Paludisphaera mucosa]|uniref:Cellulase family glycosylhydrolase n=1 Tax=Paludisphaera mucosa TaxID=3030827 RepID=A0ABT6FBE3_9BACT|nr:cellulase family glycosylhydrolase [Paludisphaera mucosa]MDG3004826.1 cellulase family glycosylhydrolase [Paludisphaera mucosa]